VISFKRLIVAEQRRRQRREPCVAFRMTRTRVDLTHQA
jgi:hypothetical protein